MKFTYQSYRELLHLLQEKGYLFRNYHNYQDSSRCAILRHDIEISIEMAQRMARIEQEEGVQSTYFVLLTSDFYNVASKRSLAGLRAIQEMGHEIGLHFDETSYAPFLSPDETVKNIIKECGLLSALLEGSRRRVSCISMHRPSRTTLEANYDIPGIVNSYSKTFFHDFKYLSDSRRRWREPVEDIIRSGEYDRLHILTHAHWYHEKEETIAETVGSFIRSANRERYAQMKDNIANLEEIMREEDI